MRIKLAAVGLAALLAVSVGSAAASAAPASDAGSTSALAGPGPGEVCTDVYDKKVGADGNSILLASACASSFELSGAIASAAAKKVVAGQVKSGKLSSEAAAAAVETPLAWLYTDNAMTSKQRLLTGFYGTCDSAGYTIAAYTADVGRISSASGINKCNTMRLRNTAGSYSYNNMPFVFPSGYNDNTNQYHPYCTVRSGVGC